MRAKLKTFLTIVILYAISILIAFYLDGRNLHVKPIQLFSFLFNEAQDAFLKNGVDESIQNINDEYAFESKISTTETENDASGLYIPGMHGDTYTCNNKRTPVLDKPGNSVYRWIGEDGVVNLSDIPPEEATSSIDIVEFMSYGKDYFSMHISYPNGHVSSDLKNSLQSKTTAIYQLYTKHLGVNKLSKVKIDLIIFTDNQKYQEYKKNIAPSILYNTSGFYSSSMNKAVVLNRGKLEETINTSIHEVSHVINHGVFGMMPDWINEGLAEYFEDISINDRVNSSNGQGWLDLIRIKKQFLPLSYLFVRENKVLNKEEREVFYANSWALVSFLMEDRNRTVVKRLFNKMVESKCDTTDMMSFFNSNYSGGVKKLQTDLLTYLARK